MYDSTIKLWFKRKYNIPVRIQTKDNRVCAWIQADEAVRHGALVYGHTFPDELGHACMKILYAGHSILEKQNWGGSIDPHRISMHDTEWAKLFDLLGI